MFGRMVVSVIVPVFNGEKFLRECLESVKACPSQEMECIIVNDGSTDGTDEICRRFAYEDARFRLINKKNTGVSDSRNRALAEASGEYVFFLDADDFILTDQWPEILAFAERGDFDMVAFSYRDLFSDGGTKEERFTGDSDIKLAILTTTLMNTCWGKLLRRDVIEKNGLSFDRELKTCEDAVFILDFTQKTESISLSNICAICYRIHSGGTMRQAELENKLSDFSVLYERRCRYLDENSGEALGKGMYRQLFSVITDLLRSYAGNRRIPEIRRAYKKNMGNPVITAIIDKTEIRSLSPVYKKFEYALLTTGLYTCLAMYFKVKGRFRVHQRGLYNAPAKGVYIENAGSGEGLCNHSYN